MMRDHNGAQRENPACLSDPESVSKHESVRSCV